MPQRKMNRLAISTLPFVAATALGQSDCGPDVIDPYASVFPNTPEPFQYLGSEMDMSTSSVATVYNGELYIYSPTTGAEIHRLSAEDGSYLWSVAIDNDIAVCRGNGGSLHVFDTIAGEQLLNVPFNAVDVDVDANTVAAISDSHLHAFNVITGEHYTTTLQDATRNWHVAAHDQYIVLVARGADSAYYAHILNKHTGFELRKIQLPADGGGVYNWDISLYDSTLAVGVPGSSIAAGEGGAVFLYDINTGNHLRTITSSCPIDGSYFGYSVSLHGNALAVGAPYQWVVGPEMGAVTVFNASTGNIIAHLGPASRHRIYDRFGESVAAHGNKIAAGSPGRDETSGKSGAIFLYEIEVPSGTCIADTNLDGVLNFFDVSLFLQAYIDMNPGADMNGDGQFTFFDVSVFLTSYLDGCP